MENSQQKNQLSVEQPQALSKQTVKVGIFEISTLPTKLFLKKSYEFEKIKDKTEDVRPELGLILMRIHGEMGFKSEIDQFTKQDLVKMILSHYNALSLEEIYKAFELERFGLYEDKTEHFQLFDSNYVSNILKKYKNWKIEQKKVLNIEAPKAEIQLDKNKIRMDFLKLVYSELKNDGYCSEAYHLYDKLESKINASDQQKKEMYQHQLKIYEIEEKQYISNRGLQMKMLLSELKAKIESKSGIEVVKNRCKSLLVCKYLEQFVSESESEFVNRLF